MQAEAYRVNTKKMSLREARQRLYLSQRELIALADHDISIKVISQCENGLAISGITAYAILSGLNKVRKQRELPELDIDDLTWTVNK